MRPAILILAFLASLSAQIQPRDRHFKSWLGFSGNPQHSARAAAPAQTLNQIKWQTPVDLAPQYSGSDLLIHYGSPVITSQNTIIVPVKTTAAGAFRVDARKATDGSLLWSASSDYVLPAANWTPEFGPALVDRPKSRLYFPGAAGSLLYREDPDSASGVTGRIFFYRGPSDDAVTIDTPLTTDADGNVYFGFAVIGAAHSGLSSGIARVSATGEGTWISAAAASGNSSITGVVFNCAPALNSDAGLLYVAVSTDYNGSGHLLALNSTSLAPVASIVLKDPVTGLDAILSSDGTASPTLGPDGDVYFGVLESSGENHQRGWLLHFDGKLTQSKIPGDFGWDDTPSIVPASMVPSYRGPSSYLLMTKYNDYRGAGGTGINRLAILDPNAGQPFMQVVLSIAGLTPDGALPPVKEWCINSAAVDPASGSILAGSEDGKLYRWHLPTNTFSESIVLTPGVGEAYTPTIVGPDGAVYAINNATLFAIGAAHGRNP